MSDINTKLGILGVIGQGKSLENFMEKTFSEMLNDGDIPESITSENANELLDMMGDLINPIPYKHYKYSDIFTTPPIPEIDFYNLPRIASFTQRDIPHFLPVKGKIVIKGEEGKK